MEKILSPAAIKTKAKYRTPGRYADGGGLYLQVAKRPGATANSKGEWALSSVTRSWLYQYSSSGKVRQMGLGSLNQVTLAQARKRAEAARHKISEGIDPLDERQAERRATTSELAKALSFEIFSAEYIATHSPAWRNEIHRRQWTSTLRTYAYPVIGKMSVATIEAADVLRVLNPIWRTKQETADRVRGRIEKILHAAKAAGLRSGDNPAVWQNHLSHLLPARRRTEKHHPAMDYKQLPDFVRSLSKRDGIAPRALEMLILTVARTGSLIGMHDSELDLRNAHTWTIPASRMKGGKEHVVPLPARAMQIIAAMPREKNNHFIFVGQKSGGHLSNMAMLELMKKIAPGCVPHGFRSSFNDWASEQTDAKHIVVEMCMAHTIKDKTEKAYRRGDLLDMRRALLEEWAKYLYGERS